VSTPGFVAGPVHVRVPATCANLGPGYDALGLALSLHDDLVAEVVDEPGLHIEVDGEGCADVPRDERHLVVVAMRRAFEALHASPAGLRLHAVNRVPHGRGLGSSAAAIVAGIALARALVVEGAARLDQAGMLLPRLETSDRRSRGSPRRGSTTRRAQAVSRPVHPAWCPWCASRTAVATSTARGLLPAQVPHADAAFNAGRAALLVAALTERPDLLLAATDDRLHQPQRAAAMPASAALVARLRARGLPAVISGAGPTVLVLTTAGEAGTVAAEAPGFVVDRLAIDAGGVREVPPSG
jgi:homoserine kinase